MPRLTCDINFSVETMSSYATLKAYATTSHVQTKETVCATEEESNRPSSTPQSSFHCVAVEILHHTERTQRQW